MSVIPRSMTVLYARICQTATCRPVYGETFCVVYMPVEDIEVVFLEHCQQIEDSLNRKKSPARIKHKTSVRIEIGFHCVFYPDVTKLCSWRVLRAGL
jgi:hypothetical protein